MTTHIISDLAWERMVNAVEKVRQRLLRAATALRAAKIPHAVAGGNAVAAWVSSVDESAVRNTQEVNVLVRRTDFDAVKQALESAGFLHQRAAGISSFVIPVEGGIRWFDSMVIPRDASSPAAAADWMNFVYGRWPGRWPSASDCCGC